MEKRNSAGFVVFMSLIISLVAGCGKDSIHENKNRVIAKIDNIEITYEEFEGNFTRRYPNQIVSNAKSSVKNKVLNDMIDQLLTLKEAYRLGCDKSQTVRDVMKRKEQALVVEAYEQQEVYDKVLPERLVKQYYDWSDRELDLLRMKFKCGNDNSLKNEKEKKALNIFRKLQHGADFKSLAAEFSEHNGAAADSGRTAVVNCFEIDKNVFEHAYGLTAGETGEPFYANNAWYIVKVEKVIEKDIDPYETERSKILENLKRCYSSQLAREFHQFRTKLTDEFHYTVIPENVQFFCSRAAELRTTEDSTGLFSDEEKALALCKTDINEITIGEFFQKAYKFFGNSLHRQRLVEKLLSKACLEKLKIHKGMQTQLNELPDVKNEFNEWLVEYLKSYTLDKEVLEKTGVSESLLDSLYNNGKYRLIEKEKRTAREIFQKTQTGIDKVYNLAMNGQDFSALEKKYQQNKETKTNGRLGPFTKGPHGILGETAFAMKPGEISKPFPYRGGYSIIKLLSIEPGRQKTFDEAKEQLKNEYMSEHQAQFITEWHKRIRKNYSITINRF